MMLVRWGAEQLVGWIKMKMRVFAALALIPVGLAASHAAAGEAPVALAALARLEPGQWELHSRDPANPSFRLCVKDLSDLLQVRHIGKSCSHFVVEDKPMRASVTYACPKAGHGRTDLRVETSRLIQLSSQGVADGLPFALNLEGRRTGECGPMARR
jgi:hypothetical protein